MEIIDLDYNENKFITAKKLIKHVEEQISGFVYSKELKDNKEVSLAIKDNGEIAGRIVGYIDYFLNHLKIELLVIEPEYRGKGVGAKLIQAIEDIAIKEDCNMSLVDTASYSSPEFYEKQGYSHYGELKDYPIPNEIYYLMYKRLNKKV